MVFFPPGVLVDLVMEAALEAALAAVLVMQHVVRVARVARVALGDVEGANVVLPLQRVAEGVVVGADVVADVVVAEVAGDAEHAHSV